MIISKKKKLAIAEYQQMQNKQQTQNNSKYSLGSWFSRAAEPTSSNFANLPTLKIEISSLEELSRQLYLELADCYWERSRHAYSKTWKGRYFHFMGIMFSFYCFYKIVNCLINIMFNR